MNTVAFERVSRAASNPNDPGSIAVSIGATDLDITLVDNEVRKVLAALHGTKDEAYAGRTNDTADGAAFLKKQLERLMKEKAQFKEKKLALLQLQEALPGRQAESQYGERPAAGGKAPAAAAAAAPARPGVCVRECGREGVLTCVWRGAVLLVKNCVWLRPFGGCLVGPVPPYRLQIHNSYSISSYA